MAELTGGQAVVLALKQENVRYVFGLIGSATMELFDALYDSKDIELIAVHDERTGCHMADGYARASGRAGVVLAGQNGPGATNLITGLAQAMAAFSPVVSIAGALSNTHLYRDAFQEVDQQSLFSAVTKKTWTLTHTERIPELFREAFRHALSGRCAPVHLNLPRDVLSNRADFQTLQTPKAYRLQTMPAASNDSVVEAGNLIQQAKRLVIVAGGGIKNSSQGGQSVMALATKLNAPVVTSPGHGDALPFDFPLNAGQMGPRGNVVASRLLKEADVILALGTRLGFNATFYSYDYLNAQAKIIQVDIESSALGRYFPVALSIWADATTVADQLRQAIDNWQKKPLLTAWAKKFHSERLAYLTKRDETAEINAIPIKPSGLFKTLRDVLPKNAAITLDAGTLCLQATDALNYFQAKSLFTPLDFGLVGFSFACGLGVKLAQPDRPVISLMGDGGFGMTVSELSTAVDYGINTITLVLNNGCWGAEKAYQRDFFDGRYIGSQVSSPAFDELAVLYGAVGYKVATLTELAIAIKDALKQNKPVVIDVAIDPSALYSFRRDSFKHRDNKG